MEGKSNGQKAPEGLTLEQQIFQKKADAFDKELAALQEKHGLVLVPIIRSNQHGIMPDLIYMDKKKFDEQMKRGIAASTPKPSTNGPLAVKGV